MVISNRKIVGEILHNCGRVRQVSLQAGVGCETDIAEALRVIEDAARANPRPKDGCP